jgi:hypothetical protein
MIATTKPNTVTTQGIQNTVSFGIKESGIAHIFNVLRNQLYTDKVTAIQREYATNAADAHVEAGCADRPIEVTLPSRFNLQFKVRDFGLSLSDDEIQDVYAFYGESTKRNTNEQTGMLGIGSKSAFAYGDNFVINSFIDGKKHTHNAFIDDTQVGQIAKLGVEDTDEENGVEIVIPVKSGDVDEFNSKAQKIFRYFKVKPIVNGKQLEYEENEVLYEGNGWKWMNQDIDRWNRGEAIVVMGNIGYPIDPNLLKLPNDSALANFACANLQLECPIGELEISASREGLQYTDFSIKNITKKLEEAAEEIASQIAKDFDECKSLWQAKELAAELFEYQGKLYSVQSFCKKRVLFDGKPLGDTSVSFMEKDANGYNEFRTDILLHQYEKSHRGLRKVTGKQARQISAGGSKVVILNDNYHRRGIISKMVHQVEDEGKTPYLLTFAKSVSKAKQKKIIKELGFIDEDFVKLADLPEAQLDGRYGQGGGTKSAASAKSGLKVFVYNGNGGSRGWRSDPESSYWDGATIKKGEDFLYLVLDRFQYQTKAGHIQSSRYLDSTVNKLLKHGLMGKHTKVYGIKLAQSHKYASNANATLLWDFVQERIETEVAKGNIAQEIADVNEVEQNLESAWRRIAEIGLEVTNKNTVFAAFCEQVIRVNKLSAKYSEDKDSKVSALRSLAKDLNITIPHAKPSFKCSLTNTLEKHYPMLAHTKGEFGWNYSNKSNTNLKKAIVDYVNLIDETSPCG